MELMQSEVKFEVDGKPHGFTIYHNLELIGLSIESAFDNWVHRARKNYSSKSFCDYVTKKDPENIICVDSAESALHALISKLP